MNAPAPVGRFIPVDIFRGLTVCVMIVVNTPGTWNHVFPQLLHAPWHGFTLTDLVFPAFMFAIGNSLALVQYRWKDYSIQSQLLKITRRSLLLITIGLLLNWFPFIKWSNGEWVPKSLDSLRILGVLPRIGIAYALAATMILFLSDRLIFWLSIMILFFYWVALTLGGDFSLENNLVRSIDLLLIGSKHMYKGEGIPFEPEGLFSTLPAIISIIIGYLLMKKVVLKGSHMTHTLMTLFAIGNLLLLLGWIWDFSFPINKKLWTSSFVLYSSGLSILVFGAIIYLFDFKKWRFSWACTVGANPLFSFILSLIIVKLMLLIRINSNTTLYNWAYQNMFGWCSPKIGSFLFAITVLLIIGLSAKFLEKKKIFLKL